MTLFRSDSAAHLLVFDSGVGGLSVSRDIRTRLPKVAQSYLADDAFRPYGEKTETELRTRLPDLLTPICDMLRPDLVVIACNTASTTALPAIRDALSIPVVGVVPAIKPAAEHSRQRRIGVLGTPGTVRRRYVDDLIDRFAQGCEVRLQGSVALVEQAERKLRGLPVDLSVLKRDIAPLFEGPPIDAIVLACTHFPLLQEDLTRAAPYPVTWIDSGDAIARRVETLLSSMTDFSAAPPSTGTAFLTAPATDPARQETFSSFGFPHCISLVTL